eukprot:TRINITY_DN46_c0_g1_i3.p1 TRINITY_DN46_c0_g1~~TRINITY_DN46_c0_g1_i3.p1  ORF type:complete len:108 (-),score=31.59 TRINITY_DN46_c0_g1_i3:17-340(-)
MYYRGALAAILVYDVTKRKSFDTMKKWVQELQKQAPASIVLALAGNKADLSGQREIPTSDLDKYLAELKQEATSTNLVGLECSAKTGLNVNELFTEVCRKLIALYNN